MSIEHVAHLPSISRRRLAAAAIAVAVAVSPALPLTSEIGVTANAATTTKQSWRLTPGVKLTRIRYPETPNEVRVLTILPQ